jgi:hypothetical protein
MMSSKIAVALPDEKPKKLKVKIRKPAAPVPPEEYTFLDAVGVPMSSGIGKAATPVIKKRIK